jgi:hypothetical protein
VLFLQIVSEPGGFFSGIRMPYGKPAKTPGHSNFKKPVYL